MQAEAHNITSIADAEAHREQAVGEAKGAALRAQVDAYTGEGAERQFRKEVTVAMADALAKNGNPLVPNFVMGGGNGQGGNAVDAMVAMLASKMFEGQAPVTAPVIAPVTAHVEKATETATEKSTEKSTEDVPVYKPADIKSRSGYTTDPTKRTR